MAEFTTGEPCFEIGETFTMAGQYKRRTFKQWLRREPKVLKVFVITQKEDSMSIYTEKL